MSNSIISSRIEFYTIAIQNGFFVTVVFRLSKCHIIIIIFMYVGNAEM